MQQLYGYPDIGSFGLGHSLLAWGRCVAWCKENDARMLAPRWLRLRIGPYVRRELDKREYFKLFNSSGYIGEPVRSYLLLVANKIQADNLAVLPDPGTALKPTVVVFSNAIASNFEKHFYQIKGRGAELHQELRRITRGCYLPQTSREPFVAVHVRLGDFSPFDKEMIDAGFHNQRLPILWYCDAVDALRQGLGFAAPVRVYSDGEDRELAPLLAMGQVVRAKRAESITHMLDMANAAAIISTGSGFSLWSAFFGQMPRITFPKQNIVSVNDHEQREWCFDCGDSATIPPEFIENVRKGLSGPRLTKE